MSHARPFRFATELHQPLPGASPIAAMAAAAAITTTLTVGALVFDCDFRWIARVSA